MPSSAVASVAGNPISTRAFDHSMYVDAKGEASQQFNELVISQVPPTYTKCVSQVRKTIPSLAKTKAATLQHRLQGALHLVAFAARSWTS